MTDLSNPNLITRENLVKRVDDLATSPGVAGHANWKILVLDVLSLIAAAAAAFAYRRYLGGMLSPWLLVAAVSFYAVTFGLQGLVGVRGARRLLVLVGEMVVLAGFFYAVPLAFLLPAAAVAFMLLLLGYFEVRRELHFSTELRFFAATKGAMGKFTTAILLFALTVAAVGRTPETMFLSKDRFDAVFEWGARTAENFYPSIPFASSVGDIARTMVTGQLNQNTEFRAMPASAQSSTVSAGTVSFIDGLSQGFGVAVGPSDSLADVTYRFIIKVLGEWQAKFGGIFSLVWVLVLFIVLRSIGILFTFLAQILLMVFYEILTRFGAIRVKEEATTREVIEF